MRLPSKSHPATTLMPRQNPGYHREQAELDSPRLFRLAYARATHDTGHWQASIWGILTSFWELSPSQVPRRNRSPACKAGLPIDREADPRGRVGRLAAFPKYQDYGGVRLDEYKREHARIDQLKQDHRGAIATLAKSIELDRDELASYRGLYGHGRTVLLAQAAQDRPSAPEIRSDRRQRVCRRDR